MNFIVYDAIGMGRAAQGASEQRTKKTKKLKNEHVVEDMPLSFRISKIDI